MFGSLRAGNDDFLWTVCSRSGLLGVVPGGIAPASDGIQGGHGFVDVGVSSVVLPRAWGLTQVLQVTADLSAAGDVVGWSRGFVGLLVADYGRQGVLIRGRVLVDAPQSSAGADGVLGGVSLPLRMNLLRRVKTRRRGFEGIWVPLSGQQRVHGGAVYPSTGNPRVDVVGRAGTPVLEVDSSFQSPKGISRLHLSSAVMGLTSHSGGQSITPWPWSSFSGSNHYNWFFLNSWHFNLILFNMRV